MKNRSGMTLIELLVAVVLIATLGGAIYSVFSQGLRLWQRSQSAGPELSAEIFFDKIETELRNAVSYQRGVFEGTKQDLSFYMIKKGPVALDAELTISEDQIQKIKYRYESKEKSIQKGVLEYRQLLNQEETMSFMSVFDDVENVEFSYYEINPEQEGAFWKDHWKKNCLPSAVKLYLEYLNPRKNDMMKIIPLKSDTCGA